MAYFSNSPVASAEFGAVALMAGPRRGAAA